MAPQTQRTIAVGVITTVLGVLAISLLVAAKESVVPRRVYELHVQADSSRWRAMERTLERVDERTARIERYICRGELQGLGC